jgi:hypothetical protein
LQPVWETLMRVVLDGEELFFSHVHLHGGPAPVRGYLPHLIDLILRGEIAPDGCSTSSCHSIRPPTPTGSWTSAAPSRSRWAPDSTRVDPGRSTAPSIT